MEPEAEPKAEAARGDAIVLIGMMGSGKSAVGATLAGRLGRTLVDVDQLIVASAGRPVADIFAEEGDMGFRIREQAAIRKAAAVAGAVIACGGGAVLDPGNVAALKAAGRVVWLRVSPEVAARRLGTDAGRPILASMPGELSQRLQVLIERRGPAYAAAADMTVDADGPVDRVAEAVLGVEA